MPPPAPAPRPDGRRAGEPAPRLSRTLVDQLPAIVYVADPGVDGAWHYVSGGVQTLLGFSPEEWIGDSGLWARQMHPDDRERIFGRETRLDEPGVPDEYRLRHRDGQTVWVRDDAALLLDDQGRARWHGVMSDISDRKLAERELERRVEEQAAVARLGERALAGSSFGELMNQAVSEACRVTGVAAGAVLEQSGQHDALTVRAGAGLSEPAAAERAAALSAGELAAVAPGSTASGITGLIESKAGRWGFLWLAASPELELSPADADFVQAIANILAYAISRRDTEDEIRYQALHDHLTGLPNRLRFLERLERALSGRPGAVAVVLMDIDNFKLVNDSLGHAAGDELLTQIAPRLAQAVRPRDMISRLGGDEFVILLDQLPAVGVAERVADRIVRAFEEPFELAAGEHFAKVSLGIALSDRNDGTPDALMRDADAALYEAKARGRARYEVFDSDMRARTVERLSLENDLRRALERDELQVVYQPIVSLRDGALRSVEALLRWQHPARGQVSPAEFIPVAEETGMIEPIGRWVLETACMQSAEWRAANPRRRALDVSVNLSARQFLQHDLEETVVLALATAGIEPSSLCLEITESVLLQSSREAGETVTRLARHGVRIVLDDFGTGYSSLAYLSGLAIDGLKVDRTFVEKLGTDERSTAITTAIIRMAQALSIEVIAEGVENTRQVIALRDLECELAQGFHFHRPLAPAAISELLCREPRREPRLRSASRSNAPAARGN